MNDHDEIVGLLREIRDIQREEIEFLRARDQQRQEWLDREEQLRQEELKEHRAISERDSAEYQKCTRAYGWMTIACTLASVGIGVLVTLLILSLVWHR